MSAGVYVTTGRAKMNYTLDTLVSDLDRCPHGRHMGDACSGWRGPGTYVGGCRGGVSLGNPLLPPGKVIGIDHSGHFMIRVPVDRNDRHDARGWYVPIHDRFAYEEAVEVAVERNTMDGVYGC